MDEGLPPSVDATPEELNAAARALRELGVEPVPRDVAVRLERRLDDELGPVPAVARTKRRPWWRPVMVLAPVAAAALIAVAVLLSTTGGGTTSRPTAAAKDARSKPVPTQGVASGGTGASPTTDVVPLPREALDSGLQAVGAASRQAIQVADAAKAAALRARANVCKAKPTKKGCPKPRASTTTTP
jgi:hypothetical protein